MEDRWIICRICLQESEGQMQPIFATDEKQENLADQIAECSGVELHKSPALPNKMCWQCFTLLRASQKFRMRCQRTEKHLLEKMNIKPMSPTPTKPKSLDVIPFPISSASLKEEHNNEQQEEETDTDNQTIIYMDDSETVEEEVNETYESEYIEIEDEENANELEAEDDATHANATSQHVNTEETCSSMEQAEFIDEEQFELIEIEEQQFRRVLAPRPRRKERKPRPPKMETYICSHCGNMFHEKAKLTLHMKNHTKNKPHECEICHKRFTQTPQLARHMNSHTGNRPFKCKYCTASFADPSTRIKHERIHTNERPYACDVCQKTFAYSNVLKVHMMIHTGEKPYSCDICGKKFAQLHHKRSHERTHMNNTNKMADIKFENVVITSVKQE